MLSVAHIGLHCSCRILVARLEYLRENFQIKEGDFLTFDALVYLHHLSYHPSNIFDNLFIF